GQLSTFEVPGEPFGALLAKALNMFGPLRNALCAHKVALTDQERLLARLDVSACDLKDVPNIFRSVGSLLKPTAQRASRDRRNMDDVETVILGRWCDRVFPP